MSNFYEHCGGSHLFMLDNKASAITRQISECKIKPKIIPKFADYNFVLPHGHH